MKLLKIFLFLLTLLLLKTSFSQDIKYNSKEDSLNIEEILKYNFDKSWSRFLYSGVFVMKTSFYVNSINIIYYVGLSQEKVNERGVRYVFFNSLTDKINEVLKDDNVYCNIDFKEDFVRMTIIVPFYKDVYNILKKISDVLSINDLKLSLDRLPLYEKEARNYYSSSFNSILWYFRQNVFSSHPYSSLPPGNFNNIKYLTYEKLEDFKKSITKPIFFVLLSYNQDEDKVFNYLTNQNELNEQSLFSEFSNGLPTFYNSSDFSFNDIYYYRKVEIEKTKRFVFNINSKSSYLLYLFTAPEFNKNFNEYLSMIVINNYLTDELDGVLWQKLREEKGLVYSIFSDYPLLKYTSYYVIFTSCYYKNQNEVMKIMERNFENLNLNDEELLYAKEKTIKEVKLSFSSINNLSDSLVYCILYKDKRISPFYIGNFLSSLSLNDIKRVYMKYLSKYYVFYFEGG